MHNDLIKVQNELSIIFNECKTYDPIELASIYIHKIIYWDFKNTNGVSHTESGLTNVLLNKNIKDYNEKIFTLCHELGHIRLHPGVNTIQLSKNPYIIKAKYENIADLFAVELLLRYRNFYNNIYPGMTLEGISKEYGIKLQYLKLRFRDGAPIAA